MESFRVRMAATKAFYMWIEHFLDAQHLRHLVHRANFRPVACDQELVVARILDDSRCTVVPEFDPLQKGCGIDGGTPQKCHLTLATFSLSPRSALRRRRRLPLEVNHAPTMTPAVTPIDGVQIVHLGILEVLARSTSEIRSDPPLKAVAPRTTAR